MSTNKSPLNQPMSRRGRSWLLAAFFIIQAGLLGYSGLRHSPTYDEVAHLPAGLSHWHGNYRLFNVNPPLTRMIAALPVLAVGAKTDWAALNKQFLAGTRQRVDFDVGRDFIAVNGPRAFWLYCYARWACIPLVWLGGWVIRQWASELYGERSGWMALAIWTFSPMVLGHGALITPDVSAASFGVLATHRFWLWAESPDWHRALAVAVATGLAILSKSTWLLVLPTVYGLAWIMNRLDAGPPIVKRMVSDRLGQAAAIVIVTWLLVVYGYQFTGLMRPIGDYPFQSDRLTQVDSKTGIRINRFADPLFGRFPVPLPDELLLGMDEQKKNFENPAQSYLFGELRRGGWWYYYVVAVLLKTPVGILLLLLTVAMVRILSATRPTLQECCLLLPPLIVLILVSSQTGINKHLRYLLPAYPFVIIWISQCGRWKTKSVKVIVGVCLTWAIGSSLWVYPHSLSYFNELAGGPAGGHRYLINSNADWGQDLFYLKDAMDRRGWDHVSMVYWGRYDPRIAGIEFDLPPRGPLEVIPPGRYAISVNHLRGYAFVMPTGSGGLRHSSPDDYRYFERLRPIGSAGYSMLLYEVE